MKLLKTEIKKGIKIKFPVVVTNMVGVKVAQFTVEADSKLEADKMIRKEIRNLGIRGASWKIS